MDIVVTPQPDDAARGSLRYGALSFRCALGRSGVRQDKREGDGATPAARMALRRVFYRADRLAAPRTALPVRALGEQDGWCDDPRSGDYNRLVQLPCAAGHELLWREDGVYDAIVELGWNDDPVVAGRGSAIFLHVARPGYGPTEGCVALALPDLLQLLATVPRGVMLSVQP